MLFNINLAKKMHAKFGFHCVTPAFWRINIVKSIAKEYAKMRYNIYLNGRRRVDISFLSIFFRAASSSAAAFSAAAASPVRLKASRWLLDPLLLSKMVSLAVTADADARARCPSLLAPAPSTTSLPAVARTLCISFHAT